MPRLRNLMTNKIVIARQATTSGIKMAYSTVTAEFGTFQPLGGRNTELSPGAFSKAVRFYFPGDVDVQEGDRLKDDLDNYYIVASGGINRRSHGSLDYLSVDCEKT